MEAVAAARRAAAAGAGAAPARAPSPREQHTVSWVEHSTSAAASLMEGILDTEACPEGDPLDALAALPQHLLTDSQRAAVVLATWAAAAHTKPADFDAGTQLTMPGLAGGAHSWRQRLEAAPAVPAGRQALLSGLRPALGGELLLLLTAAIACWSVLAFPPRPRIGPFLLLKY